MQRHQDRRDTGASRSDTDRLPVGLSELFHPGTHEQPARPRTRVPESPVWDYPGTPGIGRFSEASPVRVSESLQGELDRMTLIGRDADLDQLPSAGGPSDEAHRPARHRDCLGPAGVGGLDDPNDEGAVVFSADSSLRRTRSHQDLDAHVPVCRPRRTRLASPSECLDLR